MIRTACSIVTGFLGSGKTTLLKHVMQHGLRDRRVAIIMNEIGDIGIDGRVITGLEAVESMVELNSGCVCCTIDGQHFGIAVQQILEDVKPELLIIETTGLADPRPVLERLKGAGVTRDAVITLVDASTFLTHAAEHKVLAAQVRAAAFVVLNKLDLADERQRERVARRLRRLNGRALVLTATHGQVETDLLFGTSVGAYRARAVSSRRPDAGAGPGHQHGRDEIQAVSYETASPVDLDAFGRFLRKLPADVYRAKGLLRLTGGSFPHLFNFTCGWFDFQPLAPDLGARFPTQAIFIGKDVAGWRDEVVDRFRACERPEAPAR